MVSDDALIMKLLQERRRRIEDVLDGKIKQRPFRGWRRVQLSRVNAEIARRLYPPADPLTKGVSTLEREARRLAERVARSSILGDPERYRVYAADCAADGETRVVPMYGEADIAHYVETRWQDFAELLEEGRAALIKAGVVLVKEDP